MKTTKWMIGPRRCGRARIQRLGKALCAVAMLAVVVALASCASGGDGAGVGTQKVRSVAGTLASDRPGKLENFNEEISKQPVFGSSYTREQISSVTFTSTLPEDPKVKGWDVSEGGDGSVLAWFEENAGGYYDMTIAADGTIEAPEDCAYLFAGYVNAKSVTLGGVLDTNKAESMRGMFDLCQSLRSVDAGELVTSWVTDMDFMFYSCSSLESLDVSGFDTSEAKSTQAMFESCSSLSSLDVSGFDTSSVTDMSFMFSKCSSLESLGVSKFDTSKVTNMSAMFQSCSSLATIDVSSFKTSAVTDMSWAFTNCGGLKVLDLAGWDVSRAEKLEGMFGGATDALEVRYPKGDAAWEALVARDDLKGAPRFVAV